MECLPRTRALLQDLQVFHIICFQRGAGPILNLKLEPPFTLPHPSHTCVNEWMLWKTFWSLAWCFTGWHLWLVWSHWSLGGGVILHFASREACQVFNLRSFESNHRHLKPFKTQLFCLLKEVFDTVTEAKTLYILLSETIILFLCWHFQWWKK